MDFGKSRVKKQVSKSNSVMTELVNCTETIEPQANSAYREDLEKPWYFTHI